MVKVKICGITNSRDALAAISCGADAVGFLVGQVHHSTGRFIGAEKAAEIVATLPPFCSTVLVTHLSRPDEVVRAVELANVNTVQLHGDTTPDEALAVKQQLPYLKTYKVIHVQDAEAIQGAKEYTGAVDAVVLDTVIKETGQVGGTGRTHDWNISKKVVEAVSLPVILAGGLNPDNVMEAIKTVHPYAVDVNSGVSQNDGTKDFQRLKLFIARAKSQ